jgi:SnoaL-like domain
MTDPRLQELLDKQAIQEKVHLYCRAIDRLDVDLLKSVYWPEGTDDHGSFVGNAHEFSDFIMGDLRKRVIDGMHAIFHMVIELNGSFANVESYYWAYQLVPGDIATEFFGPSYAAEHAPVIDAPHDFYCGGRYIDLFEKRGEEWRVLKRKITNEWNDIRPSKRIAGEGYVAHFHLPGRRDRDDFVYLSKMPGSLA